MTVIPVYLETGARRVFAGALDWPGWCRSGRSAEAALEALGEYRSRYAAAIGRMAGFPARGSTFKVSEKLEGNATTDFGAPGIAPSYDRRPVSTADLARLVKIQRACWAAFDAAAESARGKHLRTGPRGGGRALEAIRSHVHDADRAYLSGIGGRARSSDDLREIIVATLTERAHGVEATPSPRRTKPIWTPRYFFRRSAWHALDHAWEIEDRSARNPSR